ncbi:MAG: AbrB/MazE/SpoVT family DNA-binding domain-containing protein [Moorella humiferrea]|nr:AbrB/MazE/SpoVT family DNA-binding domain-containing protein [Moorella humiferrea]
MKASIILMEASIWKSKVSSKYQIVIPKDVRELLNIKKGKVWK